MKNRAKKSLSQNFLVDQDVVSCFVKSANFDSETTILEIGPGKGAISDELAKLNAPLILIEKDSSLSTDLKNRYQDNDLIKVLEDDILTCNMEAYIDSKIRIISNLPFQITSPVLGKLLPNKNILDLTLIVQKEVAERIVKAPGTKGCSHISLFTHFYSEPKMLFDIPKEAYDPIPRVTTSAIHLKLKKPPIEDCEPFFKFTKSAFNYKRKMLSTSLPFDSKYIKEILQKIGVLETARPENLTLNQFIELYQNLFSS